MISDLIKGGGKEESVRKNESEEESQLTRAGWKLISIMTGNARHTVWQRRAGEGVLRSVQPV